MNKRIWINTCLLLLLFWFANFDATANGDILKAYINDDIGSWKTTIDDLAGKDVLKHDEKLELVNLHYGYVAWCIDKKKSNEADRYINAAIDLLDDLENAEFDLPSVYAYKGMFYGFIITQSFIKAPYYGPKCYNYSVNSLESDSLNVMGLMQMGNLKFYIPKFLGGSKTKALEYYLKALDQLESTKSNVEQDWNYLHMIALVVYASKESGNIILARKYCEKGLSIAPDFKWLKDTMCPQVEKE